MEVILGVNKWTTLGVDLNLVRKHMDVNDFKRLYKITPIKEKELRFYCCSAFRSHGSLQQ